MARSDSLQDAVKNSSNIYLDTLFGDITDLSDQHKKMIKDTLQAMLRPDSNLRISIEDAIRQFVKINPNNPLDKPLSEVGRNGFFNQTPLDASTEEVEIALDTLDLTKTKGMTG